MIQTPEHILSMLKDRGYLHDSENNWEDLSRRVAHALASCENDPVRKEWADRFYTLLAEQRFVNSSPTLMNADADDMGGLSSCFVIDIKDDLAEIHEAIKKCAKIYQANGGVGFNISALRPARAPLGTAHGAAGGPVAFMSEFNEAARVATLYNHRKSATKIDLCVWHPDIFDFIHCKDDGVSLPLMNISVAITDDFMKAVEEDADWGLVFPDFAADKAYYNKYWDGDLADWVANNGPVKVYQTVKARELFRELSQSAWKRGDPGIIFYDKMNVNNPNKHLHKVNTSNPCLRGDMRLLTIDGYRRFDELDGKTPDLITPTGFISKGCKIWCSGEKRCIELRLGIGRSIVCTPDHVFLTADGQEVKAQDLLGKELADGVWNLIDTAEEAWAVEDKKFELRPISEVVEIVDAGIHKVYDFTEPVAHWGIVEGAIAHNCAEFNSIPYSSCCLGSFNLMAYYDAEANRIDMPKLLADIPVAVRMLDNVIALNQFPFDKIRQVTQANRSIGIGVMGLADLLYARGIRFGTDKAKGLERTILSSITNEAVAASIKLATERGAYANWKGSEWDKKGIVIRNSDLTSVAPTGSISTVCGVSSSIEPNFGLVYERHTADERTFYNVNKLFAKELMDRGLYGEALLKKISDNHGSCQGLDEVPADLQEIFVVAHDLAPDEHIAMCAVVQKNISLSVSKTVNLPHDATVEEVERVYKLAFFSGLLGITVYRDGSRDDQVLTTGASYADDKRQDGPARGEVVPVSDDLIGKKRKLITGCGSLHCSTFFDPLTGALLETYLSKGSTGGCLNSLTGLSRMISTAARAGVSAAYIVDQLNSTGVCPSYAVRTATRHDTSSGSCCPMAVGHAILSMQKEVFAEIGATETPAIEEPNEQTSGRKCPECGGELSSDGGCVMCPACGWSRCG